MVAKRRKSRAPLDPEGFHIGGVQLEPGTVSDVELDMARLPTRTKLTLPVRVVRGASDGPCMWLSAGIHGDELIGIEVIRQVLEQVEVARLCGTIIAVPIVNLHGFLIRSRYLPDGRDLNRSFPGGKRGSLAA
ncbi:MAG TPA: succinylglutamate desuccinylase/aspartoacylase family protein, partial [Planctomycetota bacterium]|nr:succinylglutamate desuccinylase/aspartoacylase family protein [Planctomycetota bacterium]